MITVETFTFNPFQENTYVLHDHTGAAVIFDPGCYGADEERELSEAIAAKGLTVEKLVNTHCHIDHVFGNAFVKRTYGVPFWMHEADLETLRMVPMTFQMFGLPDLGYEAAEPDGYLAEGDKLAFGESEMEVLFVPGHAPGHIALYSAEDGICIAGDVLFREGVGRVDLPGGDAKTLMRSIAEKLFPLPEETVVYPGHGPETTIGHEKKHNPFCAQHLLGQYEL